MPKAAVKPAAWAIAQMLGGDDRAVHQTPVVGVEQPPLVLQRRFANFTEDGDAGVVDHQVDAAVADRERALLRPRLPAGHRGIDEMCAAGAGSGAVGGAGCTPTRARPPKYLSANAIASSAPTSPTSVRTVLSGP